jgi:SAM-dependent methyltransferase
MDSEKYAFFYDLFSDGAPGSREEAKRLADLSEAETVLDFGCGTGVIAEILVSMGRRVVCYEPSEAMRAMAFKRLSEDIVTGRAILIGSLAELEALGAFCKFAFARNVFPHILKDADRIECLRAMAASLIGGGRIMFDLRDDEHMGHAWTAAPVVRGAGGCDYMLRSSRIRVERTMHEVIWSVSTASRLSKKSPYETKMRIRADTPEYSDSLLGWAGLHRIESGAGDGLIPAWRNERVVNVLAGLEACATL